MLPCIKTEQGTFHGIHLRPHSPRVSPEMMRRTRVFMLGGEDAASWVVGRPICQRFILAAAL